MQVSGSHCETLNAVRSGSATLDPPKILPLAARLSITVRSTAPRHDLARPRYRRHGRRWPSWHRSSDEPTDGRPPETSDLADVSAVTERRRSLTGRHQDHRLVRGDEGSRECCQSARWGGLDERPRHVPTSDVLPAPPGSVGCGGGPPARRRRCPASSAGAASSGWSSPSLLAVALVWLSPQDQPKVAMDAETAILRWFAALRTDWLTPSMRTVATLGTAWSVTILGGGLVLALIVFKRWRHLAAFLIYLTFLGPSAPGSRSSPRARVRTASRSSALERLLDAVAPGRGPRRRARWASPTRSSCRAGPAQSAKLVVAWCSSRRRFARLYLAVDHPSDVVWAVMLGVAIPLAAFRLVHAERGLPRRPTGGARPPTSTSAGPGARRSGRRCRTSWG